MSAENPDISVVVPVHDEAGAAVPLAREIAEAHGGRVGLSNREGGGLEVRLSLPQ